MYFIIIFAQFFLTLVMFGIFIFVLLKISKTLAGIESEVSKGVEVLGKWFQEAEEELKPFPFSTSTFPLFEFPSTSQSCRSAPVSTAPVVPIEPFEQPWEITYYSSITGESI